MPFNKLNREHWLAQVWHSVRIDPNQDLPEEWSQGSQLKLRMLCGCGRASLSVFKSVAKGKVKTCGKCNYLPISQLLAKQWGSLHLEPNQELPDELPYRSGQRFVFSCSCGKNTTQKLADITYGRATTCGKCKFQPKSYWLEQKWGTLTLDPHQTLPESWGVTFKDNLTFECEKGHFTSKSFSNVVSNKSHVCSFCWKSPKEEWLSKTWGSLRIDPEQELPERFTEGKNKVWVLCSQCNGRSLVFIYNLKREAENKSCGKCSKKSIDYWLNDHLWGMFRLNPNQPLPATLSLNSNKQKLDFLCNCGRSFRASTNSIHTNKTESCGKCNYKPKAYWLMQKWGKLRIDPDQPLPDEWGTGFGLKLKVLCDCGGNHKANFYRLISKDVGSCGCTKIGTGPDSEASRILNYIKMYASDVEGEVPLKLSDKRLRYDIYVLSLKLAIEYHGLIWHSEKFIRSSKNDSEKFRLAREHGIKLIQIYSDEWRDKQEIMKGMLKSLIQPSAGKRIKPKFEIHYETPKEARTFLDTHHYLGAASQTKGKGLTITAVHGESVVGVWVFMKRETGVILWHRACWDHSYRAWNPHERALQLALPELRSMGFTKMLNFSDNRFHTGQLYEKLGFKFEKEIPPDYGYTNGVRRVSKYNLRVPAGVNEKLEAESRGWYRIWDSGKKRFSLCIV